MNFSPETFFKNNELKLVQASIDHDMNTVHQLFNNGVDINCTGREGMTPLIFAILRQDKEAINILLDEGADPTRIIPDSGSAIGIACHLEKVNVLNFLIEKGVDIFSLQDDEPLTWAAAEVNNLLALEILFQHGISVDARNGAGNTLLIESVLVNDIELAEWLINKGASVHSINTFLISAAERLQSRMKRAGDGINVPKYKHLIRMFEDRGVKFPVPTSIELKVKLGRNSITVEEAEKLNERGDFIP